MAGRLAVLLVAAFLAAGGRAAAAPPARDHAKPRRAFGSFIAAKEMRFDIVPDLYPGGYARISLYAKKASLGGLLVDEGWFRFVGGAPDVAALQRGETV